MDIETIVQHLQEHTHVYVAATLVVLSVSFVFRKYVGPVLYHAVEYVIYCTVVHVLFGGLTRVFSWFRSETTFENVYAGRVKDFDSYTTPIGLDFWQQELYNPGWLFWIEAAMALALLYIVVFVRPMRLGNARQRAAAQRRKEHREERKIGKPGHRRPQRRFKSNGLRKARGR